MGTYTIFGEFENPRRGRQARNLTTNVPKILDLKSSSEQIFSKNCRWVPRLLDYNRTSNNGHSLQRPLSSVPKVALVERFICILWIRDSKFARRSFAHMVCLSETAKYFESKSVISSPIQFTIKTQYQAF